MADRDGVPEFVIGLSSVFGVIALIGLGSSIRKILKTDERMTENRKQKKDLDDSELLDIHEALGEVKSKANSAENGRASMPILVKGTVTKGSTVARNALSNGKRSMSDQIEKDMVRN